MLNHEYIFKNIGERYSEEDKELIRKVFKNQEVIISLRKLFWQLPLTEVDKKMLEFNADTLRLIKKIVLPDIEADVPISSQTDVVSDPLLDNLSHMNPALACIMMDANDIRVAYLEQQFSKLINGFDAEDTIILKDLRKKLSVEQDEIRHINMLAYKAICKDMDRLPYTLYTHANPAPELTEAQKKEKAQKDSTR